jgi:GNAT superfamily N-acetyltransferase
MPEGPVRATDEDLDSIIALADACFLRDRDTGGMLARWPHCYTKEPGRIHAFLMREGGRAISMVAYADQTVDVEGRPVRIAGVTGVCTLPEHRGKGFMSALLRRSIEDMTARGYALSELGGDRQRYGRFGWEMGSRERQYQITRRSLTGPPSADLEVTPYQPGDLDTLIEIHDRTAYGTTRSQQLHGQVLSRLGWETWVCRRGPEIVAYLGANPGGEGARIDEFGGSYEGVVSILSHLLDLVDRERLNLCSPWDHPYNRRFFEISARWHEATPRMARIVHLDRTLEGFSEQLAVRYRDAGIGGHRSVVLGIEGRDQRVAVTFSPDGVSVSPAPAREEEILLPEDAMVRFLFCPGGVEATVDLPEDKRFLSALLPLDFFLWPLERV